MARGFDARPPFPSFPFFPALIWHVSEQTSTLSFASKKSHISQTTFSKVFWIGFAAYGTHCQPLAKSRMRQKDLHR